MKAARLLLLLLLGFVPGACGIALAAEKPDVWLEVRSPRFIVVSNAGEKQAERVGEHFEMIRSVFRKAFPNLRVDPSSPIVILAVKNEQNFRELHPEAWMGKGPLIQAGVFIHGPERNYVLLRLDAEGDNPYHALYHEYTHLVVSQISADLPTWLNEGLAEFYGNSEIHNKEVWLGEPI